MEIILNMRSDGREHIYIAIDLKSFYASVECVERKLDPLTTNLVVADESRTEKTICLAVSPSLKSYGIPGRARLFEVIQKVNEVNRARRAKAKDKKLIAYSFDDNVIKATLNVGLDYVIAPPRMAYYIEYSTKIYEIYLKYVSEEDIHVYSIDEVFIDATDYLKLYKLTAREFAMKMIKDVLRTTGITATAGIGTNLYLCKVAMDIVAKHIPADEDGVRIAELDEMSYRRQLWNHRPLTDFWRVGKGYAVKLEQLGLYTMGDIAECSLGKKGDLFNEDLLYKTFGVNAELLIDHAWGWESCTIADIKAYEPQSTSLSSGQVLQSPYPYDKGRIIVKEMAEGLALDLVEKKLVTDQIVLTVGYDADNKDYNGEYTLDRYGRKIPKHAHGTENLGRQTSSSRLITQAALTLYDRIMDKKLLLRRINIVANRTVAESEAKVKDEQLDLFTDYEQLEKQRKEEERELEREKRRQAAEVEIKKKYGKNAILKGTDFEEGATAKERNGQIGGHKA
ncbi:MAG: DNA methylase [Clostridia bacterium]|nr:DNA methylase [Clostridia bacterium]